MSKIAVAESFQARARKREVYAFLRDPAQCFVCLPGSTYGSTDADGKFDGTITVTVGPVQLTYDGWAVYAEDDPDAGRLVIKGQGREKRGSGVVKLEMTCQVVESDQVSEVAVDATVVLAGRVVRLGRGLVQGVAAEVFRDFAACAIDKLEGAGGSVPARSADVPSQDTLEDAPARGLSLLFRALWSMLRRWFGFGSGD